MIQLNACKNCEIPKRNYFGALEVPERNNKCMMGGGA